MFRLIVFTAILIPGLVAAQPQTYSFGVVPQQSAKKLASLWTPILAHINAQTGHTLQFKTAKDIPTFEKRLAAGDYDFSYMNPYHYTVFSQTPGYQAIAKRIDQKIQGIIVVRKDSPIQSLAELQDSTLAFPSPAAFAASILPRAKLAQAQIKFTPRYVSSHDSAYLGVAKGLFPAGGGVKRTLNNTPDEVKQQLRILWTTAAYTPHAFAAHPRVPPAVITAVQTAMVAMHNNDAGRALLQSIKIKHGIEPATDDDWDDVRSLDIELLDDLVVD